ncbi:MAG: hydantoinase B/oxoprolinase family protein [Paracoccaceae bacterium]
MQISSTSSADDPVTHSVIQAALNATADEMFAVLRKTSMSPIIYEVLDVGTGITDAFGNLVCSGAGIPTFVGVLDKAVKRLIEIHGDTILDGDIFLTNDPYFGGVTHLSDMVVALPVFFDGELIAWTASIAHWSDIGGMTPGSMASNASEIFQEGLRIPAVRVFSSNKPIKPVIELISVNSRQPNVSRGDLYAQIAASQRGAERITKLLQRYGLPPWNAALKDAYAIGEKRAKKGLASLPPGKWAIEEKQDDGATWRAEIAIEPDLFEVDLRDNPDQVSAPYNTSRDGAVIAAQMVYKALLDPERDANAGSFKALKVLTREGTVFHARSPAPHGYYFETRIRLYDMLWRCAAKAFSRNLPAGHFGTIGGTVIAGVNPDSGLRFTMVEPQMGGWGATCSRDGNDAMFSACHGDTFNCPAEIAEARYGIFVDFLKLRDQAGGSGVYRGGRGVHKRYTVRSPCILAVGFSKVEMPTWGSEGGENGGKNEVAVIQMGTPHKLSFASGLTLNTGDQLEIKTAGGGGWGRSDRNQSKPLET